MPTSLKTLTSDGRMRSKGCGPSRFAAQRRNEPQCVPSAAEDNTHFLPVVFGKVQFWWHVWPIKEDINVRELIFIVRKMRWMKVETHKTQNTHRDWAGCPAQDPGKNWTLRSLPVLFDQAENYWTFLEGVLSCCHGTQNSRYWFNVI